VQGWPGQAAQLLLPVQVEEPSAYKRDTWAMSKEEKLAAVPVLHSEGNRLVLCKEFGQAAAKYQEAVICLRNLQAKVSRTRPPLSSLPGFPQQSTPLCVLDGQEGTAITVKHPLCLLGAGEAVGGRLDEAGEVGHATGAQLLPMPAGAGRVL